jgi:hypothetical protein
LYVGPEVTLIDKATIGSYEIRDVGVLLDSMFNKFQRHFEFVTHLRELKNLCWPCHIGYDISNDSSDRVAKLGYEYYTAYKQHSEDLENCHTNWDNLYPVY